MLTERRFTLPLQALESVELDDSGVATLLLLNPTGGLVGGDVLETSVALGPGSLVKLGSQANQGVNLFAENVKLARAQPGCNGPRRAIQVSGTERRYG